MSLHRYYEEQRDEAIQSRVRGLHCFASLAMTKHIGQKDQMSDPYASSDGPHQPGR